MPKLRPPGTFLAITLSVLAIAAVAALLLANRGASRLQLTAAADQHGDFSLAAISADVQRYDQLGTHRTGSEGDLATTDWLESTFRQLGYTVQRHPFVIVTSVPQKTYLQLQGHKVAAFPLFPVTSTPTAGIARPLKLWNPADPMRTMNALAVIDTHQSEHQGTLAKPGFYQRLRAAASSGASAVIVLTRAGCGTYQALNADLRLPAWPVPVVLVGETDADFIFEAISAAGPATLVSLALGKNLTAYNLIADIGPANADPIVVSTPQSGWFHAAGERGSGIAVFLALARWAARQTENRFIFLANSGHERGNAGAAELLEHYAPTVQDTAFWLHLGANIGTLDAPPGQGVVHTRYAMATWYMLPQLWSLLRHHPGSLSWPVPLELGLAAGELAEYHAHGYRPLIGVFGPSPYHHCANDRFETVSLEDTREVALSLAALLSAESAALPEAKR